MWIRDSAAIDQPGASMPARQRGQTLTSMKIPVT